MPKILIADDDRVSLRLEEVTLRAAGHDVVSVANGLQAWDVLREEGSPRIAVLDWSMPGLDGLDVCRRVRGRSDAPYVYMVMLTGNQQKGDLVRGLEAGFDDYIAKPFDPHELKLRIKVGERILGLESSLAGKVVELEKALEDIKQLQGFLPICMHCKSIRDQTQTWTNLENYISRYTGAVFSHSLCGPCLAKHYPEDSEGEAAMAQPELAGSVSS